jgi:hypothetical protein
LKEKPTMETKRERQKKWSNNKKKEDVPITFFSAHPMI